MRFRTLPPAGTPVRALDLLRWAARGASATSGEDRLARAMERRFDVPFAFPTSTGRAGLALLLRALQEAQPTPRRFVIVPGYTCYSVAASVVLAGLQPYPVDVDVRTLDYDADALARAPVDAALAIIATNLYGLPNDLPRLERTAAAAGAHLIDDAAQAMAATVGGRPSGTWGAAGLFSFDKGKNVAAVDGGVVVVRDAAVADRLRQLLAGAPRVSAAQRAVHGLKAVAYAALLHPRIYWLPSQLPQLELGLTRFDTTYPLGRIDPGLAALAEVMLGRLSAVTAARQGNAAALRDRLVGASAVTPIQPVPQSSPVYLRFPLLADSATHRDEVLARLRAGGLGATASYPAALVDVPDLQPLLPAGVPATPQARDVAARILTLPTHPFVSARDLDAMAAVLRGEAAAGYGEERLA